MEFDWLINVDCRFRTCTGVRRTIEAVHSDCRHVVVSRARVVAWDKGDDIHRFINRLIDYSNTRHRLICGRSDAFLPSFWHSNRYSQREVRWTRLIVFSRFDWLIDWWTNFVDVGHTKHGHLARLQWPAHREDYSVRDSSVQPTTKAYGNA